MATIAVGDIHGNLPALQSLLKKVTANLTPEDTLVFLGDYIDRGPDSRGCIEEIVRLESEAPFRVVTLLGNHEAWMVATMDDHAKHSWLLGADAFPTVASYSPAAARKLRLSAEEAAFRLITDDVELPYEAFFQAMPASHRRFFKSLRLFHESDGAIFVHAGVDPQGGAPAEQDSRELIWGLVPDFPHGYRGPQKVVYGHRNDCILDAEGWPRPRVANELAYGIDSIATGVLTAIRMPEGEIFQSQRFR